MNKDLRQRANESADRMTRAGMTLSAGIMQELVAEAERLEAENAAEADYVRFLEAELLHWDAAKCAELETVNELGDRHPQIGEHPLTSSVPRPLSVPEPVAAYAAA
jgi:hypothetical protein